MKHKLRRIISLASVLTVGGCALGMFAGCTTKHPEVTITYSFDGKNYSVRYVLSRNDAPKTVQHFIELADAGFYDGLCVHNYTGEAMYSGGYKLVNGELEEVDYWNTVKQLEEEKNIKFTQSVWTADGEKTPLYTVYGEFEANAVYTQYSRENRHAKGALVMYYPQTTAEGKSDIDVLVERADGGKNNEGQTIDSKKYSTNCATSLFYTFMGYSSSGLDYSYCVFGMANEDDYEKNLEKGLFAAIAEYESTLTEDEDNEDSKSFTEKITGVKLNQYDPFDQVRKAAIDTTYQTPKDKPIIIKSIKVNKY